MWHRCFGKADVTVSNWEVENTQSYDKAGKGKSALVAAAVLNIKAEVYATLGLFIISAFHDIKKFFDSMNLDILFQAVMDEDFPKGTFCLGIAQHLAPRLLVISAFCGAPQQINSSILAVCFLAVALTRCYNKKIFSEINDVHSQDGVDLDLYIDDVTNLLQSIHHKMPFAA